MAVGKGVATDPVPAGLQAKLLPGLRTAAHLGGGGALDQVVAVDGGGHRGGGEAGGDELQHSHLGGGILHRHAVCRPAGAADEPCECWRRGKNFSRVGGRWQTPGASETTAATQQGHPGWVSRRGGEELD